jgi:putative transposase
MILVESHDFKPSHPHFTELDNFTKLSKNLYNATLYAVRQHFFTTGEYIGYNKVNKKFVAERNVDYYALPTKVSQQTQRLVDQNFKSFFALLKTNSQRPRIPKYLPRDGQQVAMFTNQALSFGTRTVKQGHVKLSGLQLVIKTKVDNIKFARIVPKDGRITVELGYEAAEAVNENPQKFASIDLGVNNLATVAFIDRNPLIINGKPVKSVNQYFNKTMAKLRSRQDLNNGHHVTRRMTRLSNKRTSRINDYLHKASRHLVNQLVDNRVTTLVVGYNQGWKQGTSMGKVNNQKFVGIPFYKFLSMLTYKCTLAGIELVTQEEAHTSKCSFLDDELVGHHDVYVGKRVKRGLFKTATGIKVNADVNGALNILRKYMTKVVGNAQVCVDLIEVCSTPSVFTVNT